jgi:hypothetical protein
VADPARPLAARLASAPPCLVAPVGVPSIPPDVARAARQCDRQPLRLARSERSRAPSRARGRVRAVRRHRWGDGVHDRARRRGVRVEALGGGHGQTVRWDRDRQLPGIDRPTHGEGGWRDPGGLTRPPRAGLRLPEEPPSAQVPPLAARRTGRAALPSATFPHTLPADVQIPGPSGSAQHSGCNVTRSLA